MQDSAFTSEQPGTDITAGELLMALDRVIGILQDVGSEVHRLRSLVEAPADPRNLSSEKMEFRHPGSGLAIPDSSLSVSGSSLAFSGARHIFLGEGYLASHPVTDSSPASDPPIRPPASKGRAKPGPAALSSGLSASGPAVPDMDNLYEKE